MTFLHEIGGDNKVSGDAIDWMLKNHTEAEKKRIKLFMSIPMLAFSITYIKELFGGLSPHPMMDAWSNTCDEHDPRCAASFYDRMVYSYDECIKNAKKDLSPEELAAYEAEEAREAKERGTVN